MSRPGDDLSLPLIHDPDSAAGSSFPGLDEAPTQVKPHAALGFTTTATESPGSTNTQLLGARLDHFELLDSIGVGGMGRVFRARDTRLDRLVALKVLSPELSNDPEICRRFEQEAKAAARLDDRHFARVYFFGFDKGLRYIAMEYVEGENIRQKIARLGKLGVALAVNIAIQVARGLSHAAACGVVHRDIKPSNIILTPDGTAKLVDMGLARNFFQQSSPSSELTQAGVTLGTFDYISPEQALDPREADVRSDIYSLGCTLYHALTGRPPFSKGSALQKILQHQNDAVPDPRRFTPDLPEPVVSILLKMLAKDPKERYQHPAELIDDLRAVASFLEIPLPDEQGSGVPVRLQQGFWERQLAWAAPLLLLLAGIAIYAFLDRPSSPLRPSDSASPTPVEDVAEPVHVEATEVVPSPGGESASKVSTGSDRSSNRKAVAADADLWTVLRNATTGTTLSLLGDRYTLNGSKDKSWSALIARKELRIEPASQSGFVEIVVRPTAWSGGGNGSLRHVLGVENGSIEFRRIAFLVEPPSDSPMHASANSLSSTAFLSVRGGTLTLSECLVRIGEGSQSSPIAAVELDSSPDRKRAELLAQQCIILGADEFARVVSTGETTIEAVDCGIDQVNHIPFRFDGLGDVSVALEHCTIRAASARMFRAGRMSGLRLHTHACVFACDSASGADSSVPFVDVLADGAWQGSKDSWWTGRANLYGGYEQVVVHRAGLAVARGFTEARKWGFDESSSRIVRSSEPIFTAADDAPLGMSVDSGQEAIRRLALRSEMRGENGNSVGVRQSPWGDVYASLETAAPDDPTASIELTRPETTSSPPAIVVESNATDSSMGLSRRMRTAFEEAQNGATIYLRIDGAVPVSGLQVLQKRVTLRPAEGFSPVLVYRAETMDNHSLFQIASAGHLSILGIPIQVLDVPATMPSVFQLQSGGSLTIEDAWVHVLPENQSATPMTFEIRTNSAMDSEASPRVELLRTTVRTQGTLLSVDSASSWSLSAADSFFVSAAGIVRIDARGYSDRREVKNPLAMTRCTVLTGGPVLSIEDRIAANLTVGAVVDQSLFLGYASAPFSVAKTSDTQRTDLLLQWKGRDNFLAGFSTFQQVSAPGDMESEAKMLAFDGWARGQGLPEGSHILGSTTPVGLRTGRLREEPPPNLEFLRQSGYPATMGQLPGVNAQLLPSERKADGIQVPPSS